MLTFGLRLIIYVVLLVARVPCWKSPRGFGSEAGLMDVHCLLCDRSSSSLSSLSWKPTGGHRLSQQQCLIDTGCTILMTNGVCTVRFLFACRILAGSFNFVAQRLAVTRYDWGGRLGEQYGIASVGSQKGGPEFKRESEQQAFGRNQTKVLSGTNKRQSHPGGPNQTVRALAGAGLQSLT